MDIIALAFDLARAVEAFVQRARRFFYDVMLSGHVCPRCGGRPAMIAESRCRCTACGHTFNPTVAFQRCSACGSKPKLRMTRYECRACGRDVPSRFVFDGLVFDSEYFRQRMAESRQRKQQRREEVRAMLAETRSEVLEVPAGDLQSVPGLVEALDGLVGGPEASALLPLAKGFDLKRYETHLQAHIGPIETCFDEIPPLEDDARRDRIWRFVAIVFMAHAGLIEVWQEGQEILVMQHGHD